MPVSITDLSMLLQPARLGAMATAAANNRNDTSAGRPPARVVNG